MTANLPDNALELRSLVTSHGTLELSLHDVPIPVPSANQVLVGVEAPSIGPRPSIIHHGPKAAGLEVAY
jgi:NADPH:quinone reductase